MDEASRLIYEALTGSTKGQQIVNNLAEYNKVYKIANELDNLRWELRNIFDVSIDEGTKNIILGRKSLSPEYFKYTTEQFNFWKQRLVSYIAENLSKDEASNCHKKLVFTFSNSDPIHNIVGNAVKSCDSYINALIGDLNKSPDYWLKKISSQSKSVNIPIQDSIEKSLQAINLLCKKFHTVVNQLRKRHANRKPLDVTDEYDVQYLLLALLKIFFDDIRPEEWTPTYAGSSSKMDFLLKGVKTVIETKMTRDSLKEKDIGNQLIIDIAHYQQHPDCETLVCFIYDPDNRISNPVGLANDLEKQSNDKLKVKVIIQPT